MFPCVNLYDPEQSNHLWYELPDPRGKQLFTSPVLAKPEAMHCVNICSPLCNALCEYIHTGLPFVYILQQRFPVSQLDIIL